MWQCKDSDLAVSDQRVHDDSGMPHLLVAVADAQEDMATQTSEMLLVLPLKQSFAQVSRDMSVTCLRAAAADPQEDAEAMTDSGHLSSATHEATIFESVHRR